MLKVVYTFGEKNQVSTAVKTALVSSTFLVEPATTYASIFSKTKETGVLDAVVTSAMYASLGIFGLGTFSVIGRIFLRGIGASEYLEIFGRGCHLAAVGIFLAVIGNVFYRFYDVTVG